MSSIDKKQQEIIENFSIIEDKEQILYHLIELGEELPPMDTKNKVEKNKIKGCLSSVWISCEKENDKLFFNADSNTSITKGLASLLIKIFSGETIDTILNSNISFIEKINLKNLIGTQRLIGYNTMLKQIKLHALTHK